MDYVELYQEDPGLLILILIISIVLTLFVYGAFPVIFAKTRKTPITKKKYRRLCFCINIIGFVFFALIDGVASGGPYLLWTGVFSSAGVKTLKKKGLLLETEPPKVKTTKKSDTEDNQTNTPTATAKTIHYPQLSLSFPDEPQKEYGDYNVYGKDIAYTPSDNEGTTKDTTVAPAEVAVKTETPKKEKKVKTRYCSRCGSLIDNKTKACTGCGKQYFKIRFTKFTILAIILVISIIFNVVQLIDRNAIDERRYYWMNEADKLQGQVNDLENEKWENWAKLYFFDNHAVIVDEHSKKYHKYKCDDLDTSYFWIYNTEAAEAKGYYACPKCH